MSACTCRPARAEDRQAIFAFTAKTWEWGDYLPQVWEAWLADPQGELSVTEIDGQVVAVGKLTVLGSREGWLEGHRVDPAYRQQGISLSFTAYQVEKARKIELRVLRLGTGSNNTAIHRVAAKLGFHRLAAFAPWVAEGLSEGAPLLTRLDETHYGAIMNWLGRSPILRAGAGLYAQGWSWQELTGKKVHGLLAAGQVMGLPKPDGGRVAFAILGNRAEAGEPQEGIQIGYVDGEWKSLEPLALALRGLAAGATPPKVSLMLLNEPTLRGIFQAAGFRDDFDDHDLWIFEKVFL